MDSQAEGQQAAEDYAATLSELDSTEKRLIRTLTVLATEDYLDYAIHIAACIENHLRTVPSKKKLPVMYLIYSICKNYPKSSYVQLFTQNIVSNFCSVYEVSSKETRDSLRKLKRTWDTTKTFPPNKLNAIDERVHKIDPTWPVVNRIATRGKQSQQSKDPRQQTTKQEAHQNKRQKVETSSNGQNLEVNSQNQVPYQSMPIIQTHVALQPNMPLDTTHLIQPIPLPPHTTAIDPLHLAHMSHPLEPTHILQTTQLDPTRLVQPLQQIPIQQPQQQLEHKPQSLPDGLDQTLDSLYGGKQCSNCSLRFDDNNKYAIHLDWHFRQNLKSNNMFARKKWYYPLNLWVQFREINDDETQETSISDSNNVNDLLISHNDHEVPYAPASIEDEKNICPVCHETFEKFWAEDEEEWRLRNARLHDDQRVYHPLCLMDMLQHNVVQ